MRTRSLLLLPLVISGLGAALRGEPVPGNDSAVDFINTREAVWFDHKHPEIVEGYPFGRSDAANNAALDKVFTFTDVSKDFFLRNKRYLAEGDWYVVEWFYGATSARTGAEQIEASLCFGRIKDQKLIEWIEYFDDSVGEMQMAGVLPLYDPGEEPFPWPRATYQRRSYRP